MMNRREFLTLLCASGAELTLFSSLSEAIPRQHPQPNILLIVADDQGYADMSCAGLASDVYTPNLDWLAARGIRFTQAYATSPICSPSRDGIETGCYQQRFGMYWYGGNGLHDPKFKTIAEILKEHGYTNGYVGKYHYGGPLNDPQHRNFPLNHGFDYLYGLSSARKHYLNHKAELEIAFMEKKKKYNRTGQSLQQGPIWINRQQKDQKGYSTELISEKACEFVRKNKDKPFYLHLSFNAVHNFTHQLPEEYLKEHRLKGYYDWDPAKEEYYDWYKQSRYPNNPQGRAHYLGQLYHLDSEVGKVLSLIKELKIEDNTLVIYISDNGGSTPIYANNYPLRGSKYTLYEGGIRVPLIVSWPGKFEQGKVCNNVVSAMDILPTVCTVIGATIPSHVDGKSISKLLKGQDSGLLHETLVWDTELETAVRHGKWKLKTAKSKKHTDYEMVEMELGEFLYDLEEDPGEKDDVAKKHPQIVKKLKDLYSMWKKHIIKGDKPSI